MKQPKPASQILRDNMTRLMDDAKPKMTQVSVASLSKIPQRTVGRIKNGEMIPTLTMLDGLAKAFKLEPWQLLVPNIKPGSEPKLVWDERRLAAIERVAEAAKELATLEKS